MKRTPLTAALVFFMPLLAGAQSARESAPTGWSSNLSISETAQFDSNPLRSVDDAETLLGTATAPAIVIRHKTSRTMVESDTRATLNRYNKSRFNSNDLRQNLSLIQSNARWTLDLQGTYNRDTTRTSELTNFGATPPRVYRNEYKLSPKLTYRASAQDTLGINSSVSEVNYDHAAYTDYQLASITPYIERRMDERHSATLSLRGSRYEAQEGTRLVSTSIGPELGWKTRHTAHLSSRLSAGTQRTHKNNGSSSDADSWNYIFSGNLTYQDPLDTLTLQVIRTREPFGNGTETLLSTFGFTGTHRLNTNLSLTAQGMYQLADYSTDPGTNLDNRLTLASGLRYTLSETVDMQADYRYRNENLTHVDGGVQQHAVMLGLNYHPDWRLF